MLEEEEEEERKGEMRREEQGTMACLPAVCDISSHFNY